MDTYSKDHDQVPPSTETTNSYALSVPQDPSEVFEVMNPPPDEFDPYKDRPLSTGRYAKRSDAHRQGLWHCSVHIWIVRKRSFGPFPVEILLQKRSMTKDTFPGRWDISSAGHMEAGKGSLETACLELAEELGVVLDPKIEALTATRQGGEHRNHVKDRLHFAFITPAEAAPLGGCNAYEHVYFLIRNSAKNNECNDCEEFSLGKEEVSEVSWVPLVHVLSALRSGDKEYAPRTKQYVELMEKELGKIFDSNK
mmetsp:Transcript_19474/g.40802  ORF Transcript_19474/g.40802 Transcript_19474/m.40802 type:complete len:253 (-) Transcript_19474:132-890(-)